MKIPNQPGSGKVIANIKGVVGNCESEGSVLVDNGANRRVYPRKADFTFYGGIYRDINLIIVPHEHFSPDHFGGAGIKVPPEFVHKLSFELNQLRK